MAIRMDFLPKMAGSVVKEEDTGLLMMLGGGGQSSSITSEKVGTNSSELESAVVVPSEPSDSSCWGRSSTSSDEEEDVELLAELVWEELLDDGRGTSGVELGVSGSQRRGLLSVERKAEVMDVGSSFRLRGGSGGGGGSRYSGATEA